MSEIQAFPVPEMLWSDWAIFIAGLGIGVGAIFEIINLSVDAKNKDRVYTWTNFWLIMSGVIHCWIEFNFTFYRGNSNIVPGMDMYAAADYRYGNYGGMMESGTAAMEAITALIDGPLCFLVAFAAAHNFAVRHPLQLILCVMQLYGLVWFVLQPLFSNKDTLDHFSRDPVMFWGIAVGCNAPWAIFPVILLVQSFAEIVLSLEKTAKQQR